MEKYFKRVVRLKMEKYFKRVMKKLERLMADACQIEADSLRQALPEISTPMMEIRAKISIIQYLIDKMRKVEKESTKDLEN